MEEEFDSRLHDKLVGLSARNTPEATVDALSILLKLLQNIVNNPGEAKFRSIKRSNKVIASKVMACNGVYEILTDVGFIELDSDILAYQLTDDDRLEQATVLTEVVLHELRESLKTDEQKAHELKMFELKQQNEAKARAKRELLQQAALDRRENSDRLLPTQASHAVNRGPGHSTTWKDIGVDLNTKKRG